MELGFIVVAAKAKSDSSDAPANQPMRSNGEPIRRKPSTDQKKVRRQLAKNASVESEKQPTFHLLSDDDEEAVRLIKEHHSADALPKAKGMAVEDLEFGKKALEEVIRNQGFSLNIHQQSAPSSGYMVSTSKNTERVISLASLTAEDIARYREDEAALLSKPDAYLGAWVYEGNVYLDVSEHFSDISTAMDVARQANQLAIYDLVTGTSINTTDKTAMKTADVHWWTSTHWYYMTPDGEPIGPFSEKDKANMDQDLMWISQTAAVDKLASAWGDSASFTNDSLYQDDPRFSRPRATQTSDPDSMISGQDSMDDDPYDDPGNNSQNTRPVSATIDTRPLHSRIAARYLATKES